MKKKIFCIFLIAVLAVSALCTFAACNDNVIDTPVEDQASIAENNQQLNFAMHNRGVTLKKVANTAEIGNTDTTSATITAVVGGEATDKSVTWSIDWNNPASEWATGKDVADYITLDADDETNTVTVDCLQPFAEQAIITCKADGAVDLEATATVDYRKRLLGVEANCNIINLTDGNPSFVNNSDVKTSFAATLNYSIGTLDCATSVSDFQITSVDLQLSDAIKAGIAGDVANAGSTAIYAEKITVSGTCESLANSVHLSGPIGFGNFFSTKNGSPIYEYAARGRIWKNVNTSGWFIRATVHISARINGSVQTFDLPLDVSISNIHFTDYTLPDSLTLTPDRIVF